MKISLHHFLTASIVSSAFLSYATLAHAQAEYRLFSDQGSGWNWGQTAHGNPGWRTMDNQPHPTLEMDSTGTYYTYGFQVRTPENGSSASRHFLGAHLVVDQGSTLVLKGVGPDRQSSVSYMTLSDSMISAGDSGSLYLAIDDFEVLGNNTFTASQANRNIYFSADVMRGNGNLLFNTPGHVGDIFGLNIIDGTGYTGNITVQEATLALSNDLEIAGTLTLSALSKVNLTHGITVSAFNIGDQDFGMGTYSFDYLSDNFGGIFESGDSSLGYITVIPEPSTYALIIGALAMVMVMRRKRN